MNTDDHRFTGDPFLKRSFVDGEVPSLVQVPPLPGRVREEQSELSLLPLWTQELRPKSRRFSDAAGPKLGQRPLNPDGLKQPKLSRCLGVKLYHALPIWGQQTGGKIQLLKDRQVVEVV